jgi:CheY-like chemotaxis protein
MTDFMNKPTTFLLIDDDVDDISLFEEVLQQVDPAVTFASAPNGQDALAMLTAASAALPDIIFLDLNMPRMDGRQCLAALKQDDNLKQIPVIMYTTSSQPKDIEQALKNGAVCYITKPTSLKELQEILEVITGNVHQQLEEALRTLRDAVPSCVVC